MPKKLRPRKPPRASIHDPAALLLRTRYDRLHNPVRLGDAAGPLWRSVVVLCCKGVLQHLRAAGEGADATPAELREAIAAACRDELLKLCEPFAGGPWRVVAFDALPAATSVSLALLQEIGVVERVDRWAGGRKPGRRWAWREVRRPGLQRTGA